MKQKKSQSGFAMLEIFMALGIGLAALSVYIAYEGHIKSTREAQASGKDWSQIGSAMRAWVGLNAGKFALDPPQGGVIYYSDLNFLRNPSCGGTAAPGEDFLPCHVANYGLGRSSYYENPTIETEIRVLPPANIGDVASIEVRATQVISDKSTIGTAGKVASIIANSARQDILGPNDPVTGKPTMGSFISFWSNASVDADPNNPFPSFGADTGRVVMALSNSPSNDAWLRVDGTNQMLANLNMGNGTHSLVNAKNIEANGLGIFGEGIVSAGDIMTTSNIIATNGIYGDDIGIFFGDDMLINDVSIGGVNPLVSTGIYDARTIKTGDLVEKPICHGIKSPQIIASPLSFASDDLAKAIHAVNVNVSDVSSTAWQVKLDILTSDGWIEPLDPNIRRLTVFTKCS